ncbi:homocysteine S-methyltransferase [Sporolactobacillus terrae]|uniref:Homocysteine S-methyltransferase n=1 Tax=Sporolactobacillus terrae TaxID=269673 RepID=A0ABX5Q5B9_9BACL|nr:homocysteine S-methyltransferase [Sporolactobacillus terrae]QAA21831.1 homocysteine S-methyltransferase [Sporolactobacillus terrae]QAA24804.1 homocysteine S-methyltransferase [Sporolactobacillus terrae]UAK16629.1 homocysteine S-methyltransferase [Sporolactobacillus terrae]
MTQTKLSKLLKQYNPIILDGAMATEIEKHGIALDSELWSAAIIQEHPEIVKQVHLDYFKSGADIATTNTYQATLLGFQQSGYSEQEAEQIICKTVQLAAHARAEFWASLSPQQQASRPYPLIAGSVGPYGAYLADGSEYSGDYTLNEGGYRMFHQSRMQLLKKAGTDLFAFETMPNFAETQALAKLLRDAFPQDEAWLSFSLKDPEHLCDGTPLAEAAAFFKDNDQIAAIGVNCFSMMKIEHAITAIRAATNKPIVAYPNSGEKYHPIKKIWISSKHRPSFYEASQMWAKAGASLIGGCCRTSPDDIREIAEWARA